MQVPTPASAVPAPAAVPFAVAPGSSWVVSGRRVRWSVAKDGCSVRAHSPVDVRSGKRLNGHNVVKISTPSPLGSDSALTRGVVNVALAYALASPRLRTVRLEQLDDGTFAVSVSDLPHAPARISGGDVRALRHALAQLARLEAAMARVSSGTHTDADVSLLRRHCPQVQSL